jgi:hypothetical protein
MGSFQLVQQLGSRAWMHLERLLTNRDANETLRSRRGGNVFVAWNHCEQHDGAFWD